MDHYIRMTKFILITINFITFEFITIFYENIELKYSFLKGIVFDRDIRITFKFWVKVCSYS